MSFGNTHRMVQIKLEEYSQLHSKRNCGGKFAMILKTDDLLALGDLGIVKVPFVPYVACNKCEAAFIAPEFQPGLEEHIAKQLVVSPNLLTKPQLRFLRVFFGLTQEDVANRIGVTDRHYYQKLESKKSELHMTEYMQLRLKIGYAELLKITDAKVLYELTRRLADQSLTLESIEMPSEEAIRVTYPLLANG